MREERGDPGHAADLRKLAAGSRGSFGTVWTLAGSEDLNANLVLFSAGSGVGEHVSDEVDVVLVGVAGSGSVTVEGKEHPLAAGRLVFIPKGVRRSVRSGSEDFAYLSLHRRKGALKIGGKG
ncbi:cupin domain-containing protein [Rubrobacter taiwanensis]|uniref:Cupin domain-containing protein n=1 Tax=Rubrobacter taiwanensis TaxID=185139 RepID=A0A4R1BQL3_9ACTN|nr:cupin domain-containing protein [Rubrobacter taiwanensis]TCJ19994.1 cupin domain-containing protein [Rubrobacter taiwanensis]